MRTTLGLLSCCIFLAVVTAMPYVPTIYGGLGQPNGVGCNQNLGCCSGCPTPAPIIYNRCVPSTGTNCFGLGFGSSLPSLPSLGNAAPIGGIGYPITNAFIGDNPCLNSQLLPNQRSPCGSGIPYLA